MPSCRGGGVISSVDLPLACHSTHLDPALDRATEGVPIYKLEFSTCVLQSNPVGTREGHLCLGYREGAHNVRTELCDAPFSVRGLGLY